MDYIKTTVFKGFNVIDQDFWPSNDQLAMTLINYRLMLDQKKLHMLSANIHWLPRLMQTYSGLIDVHSPKDAALNVLIANLAGTTLLKAEVSFLEAEQAFLRIFQIEALDQYSELKAF